jgi:hypothetical protein
LKLAILVPQYFYQHRNLSLPGIGIFSLDDKVVIPDSSDKNVRDFLQHIQFKQFNVLKADDTLIDFIRTHTGKIKPLAESDLESYVADGKLMLNIGKPFHIEGIGTLIKNRNGVYEFTPGEPMMERMEAFQPIRDKEAVKTKEKGREKETQPQKKSVFADDYYPHETKGTGSRKLMILAGVVLGLAVVVWGGYSLYNSKVDNATTAATDTNILAVDSAAIKAQADSLAAAKAIADSIKALGVEPGNYKFIFLSTTSKQKAFRHYGQVSRDNPRIKIESNSDSTLFSVFMVLPATPADTIRMKDSLNTWYYGSKPLRVTIGH